MYYACYSRTASLRTSLKWSKLLDLDFSNCTPLSQCKIVHKYGTFLGKKYGDLFYHLQSSISPLIEYSERLTENVFASRCTKSLITIILLLKQFIAMCGSLNLLKNRRISKNLKTVLNFHSLFILSFSCCFQLFSVSLNFLFFKKSDKTLREKKSKQFLALLLNMCNFLMSGCQELF